MAQEFSEQQKTEAGKEKANNPHTYQGALQRVILFHKLYGASPLQNWAQVHQ